jgi:hypothetical protein
VEPIDLETYSGEWIEWTEAELNEIPTEKWLFYCEGTRAFPRLSPELERMKPGSPGWDTARPIVAAAYKDARRRSHPHKDFALGAMAMDRNGAVTLTPRFPETMQVDAERRTVTFVCLKRPCNFRQAISLDRLIVTMSQTATRCERMTDEGPDDYRPMRWSRRRIPVWDYLTLEPSGEIGDEKRDIHTALEIYVKEYTTRRKPERVVMRDGTLIMELP